MFTQTDTTISVVTQDAEAVITLLRKDHMCPRIITDLQGPISGPVFNSKGDMIYMPYRKEDEAIIPKEALRRHELVENAGLRIAQVIIGHEITIAPEKPTIVPAPKPEIDWGNVAEVATKGILIATMGIAMISFYALIGSLQVIDPSYCICILDRNDTGTVIELLRWNSEV